MSDSEVDYLQPDFDPQSVTMPRLRSILVTHNVQYPSTAKKQQLIDLFSTEVAPQARKLLAQRARAKRSSLGIVNAGDTEETEAFMPPPSARRSRSPRKATSRVKTEEPEEPQLPSPRKRTSRAGSRPVTQASDTDDTDATRSTITTATRRTNRRTVTPQIKSEEMDEQDPFQRSRSRDPDSVFTDDNPFQSGGSSPPPVKTPSTNRRKTTGMETTKGTAGASERRRRTDGPSIVEQGEKFSKTFEIPVSTLRARTKTPEPSAIEPGEEFTPEEQLELDEAAANGEVINLPRNAVQAPPRRKSSLATPLWVLLVTILGAYAAWYRQEKVAVGYCGLGRPATKLLPPEVEVHVPDWLTPYVEPQCEPCPPHAYCYEDFVARCETDFILKAHPLSLGGLVPLPPTCEPDGEKVRRIKVVADKAVEELRERRAQYECGELPAPEGQEPSPAMAEEELKEVISRKRIKRMNRDEFDDLWGAAIGEVKERDEVEVVLKTDSGSVSNTYLSSSSLARLPLGCAIKRSIRLGLERHRLSIGLVTALSLLAAYARARYRAHAAASAQVPALVDLVIGRLSQQKELGEEGLDDPWLFLPNLRDDVLRSIHALAERERIWSLVKVVVEQNSNVRTSQREGRSGEVGRAWEWIGPLSGEGAVRRRRSGRVSWGPDVKGEDEDEQQPEMAERLVAHKKWEEGRPIY